MQPLLANSDLKPDKALLQDTIAHFTDFLRIRYSSPLFRLRTDEQILNIVHFHNARPEAIPGLIVMSLADVGEEEADVDPDLELVVALFNARPESVTFSDETLTGMGLTLHPVLAARESRYANASYDAKIGVFTVPARSAAVFVAADIAEDFIERFAALRQSLEAIRSEQPSLEEIQAAAAVAAAQEQPVPQRVSFPGTIGSALGGADWAPDDPAVQAAGEGLGIWALVANLPAGEFEFKWRSTAHGMKTMAWAASATAPISCCASTARRQ